MTNKPSAKQLEQSSIADPAQAAAALRFLIAAYDPDPDKVDRDTLAAAENWARSALGLPVVFRHGN